MMAPEMRGPTNEEALPTILKREKKRNSLPRGVTSEICTCLGSQNGRGGGSFR